MIKVLKEFTATAAEKIGKIEISNEKERFCFLESSLAFSESGAILNWYYQF